MEAVAGFDPHSLHDRQGIPKEMYPVYLAGSGVHDAENIRIQAATFGPAYVDFLCTWLRRPDVQSSLININVEGCNLDSEALSLIQKSCKPGVWVYPSSRPKRYPAGILNEGNADKLRPDAFADNWTAKEPVQEARVRLHDDVQHNSLVCKSTCARSYSSSPCQAVHHRLQLHLL